MFRPVAVKACLDRLLEERIIVPDLVVVQAIVKNRPSILVEFSALFGLRILEARLDDPLHMLDIVILAHVKVERILIWTPVVVVEFFLPARFQTTIVQVRPLLVHSRTLAILLIVRDFRLKICILLLVELQLSLFVPAQRPVAMLLMPHAMEGIQALRRFFLARTIARGPWLWMRMLDQMGPSPVETPCPMKSRLLVRSITMIFGVRFHVLCM